MMMNWMDIENMADEYEYELDEMAYINEMDAMEQEAPTEQEMERMAQALA